MYKTIIKIGVKVRNEIKTMRGDSTISDAGCYKL